MAFMHKTARCIDASKVYIEDGFFSTESGTFYEMHVVLLSLVVTSVLGFPSQVLLSGLIGVVSWKRPLSLVVSVM